MKHSGSFLIHARFLPYVETALQYGLMAVAFCLLFVNLHNISEYLFIGLLIVWALKQLWVGSFEFEKTPLAIPILLFLCWVLLTIPFATDWAYSFQEWRKAVPRFLMFWFVVNVVTTEQHVRAILHSFSIGLFLLTVVEVLNFLVQGEDVFSMAVRAGSLTGSSQWFSNYLVIGVPLLCLGFMCDHRFVVRVAYAGAMGVAVVGLVFAHTRAAWVAVLFQASIYVLWKLSRSWLVTGLAAALMLGLLLTFMAVPGKSLSFLFANEFTDTGTMAIRYNTWSLALEDIREAPVTGIGYGKHSFHRKHPDLKEGLHTHVHNMYLSHAVQVGIPGLLFLLWMFLRLLKHLSRRWEIDSEGYQGKVALALLLMTVGLVVRNVFDDMFGGTVAYLFWLLIGLSFCQYGTRELAQSESALKSRPV